MNTLDQLHEYHKCTETIWGAFVIGFEVFVEVGFFSYYTTQGYNTGDEHDLPSFWNHAKVKVVFCLILAVFPVLTVFNFFLEGSGDVT